MGMRETACWDWWWGENCTFYERVGPDAMVGELSDPAVGRSNRSNYRIDAVVGNGPDVTIIEVKDSANMTAIGQLVGYSTLFRRCYAGADRIRLLLLALRVPLPIRTICDDLGIGWAEAPDSVHQAICTRSLSLGVASSTRLEEDIVVTGDGGDDVVGGGFPTRESGEEVIQAVGVGA